MALPCETERASCLEAGQVIGKYRLFVKYVSWSLVLKGGLAVRNYIIVGADMSDERIALEIAHNERRLGARSFGNDPDGWEAMARHLEGRARACGGAQIALAYEAGPHGMGLHDSGADRRRGEDEGRP